jgi:hypothetical protein
MKRARKLQLQERIRRNSQVDETTGCWLWTARINNQGYPTMSVRLPTRDTPYTLFAHRVSLEVFERPPREGEEAAHDPVKCPHRHCVNFEHLRWATRSENELDKRHARALRLREVHPPVHALGLSD